MQPTLSVNSFAAALERLGVGPGPAPLLSVSGGVDSMTLWHLVRALGFPHEVAHVNFGLRGDESDADERLVREVAAEYGVLAHVHTAYSKGDRTPASGVQAWARSERQSFTKHVAEGRGGASILLAHNANDQAETILLQLARGTGGLGLSGMRPARPPFLRPLLAYPRAAIAEYAERNEVAFREDATNATTKYTRNAIRHDVLPAFEAADPRALGGILQTAAHQRALTTFAAAAARHLLAAAQLTEASTLGDNGTPIRPPRGTLAIGSRTADGPTIYRRSSLAATPGLTTLLHFWLSPLGYRSAQISILSLWLTDDQPQRRRMDHPDATEAIVVAGSKVYRQPLPHDP